MTEALPTRADFPVLEPVQTRWADNDQYGHANNVVYYAWFDTVVNGWLGRQVGDVTRLPALGVVVETSCRYLASVAFPDALTVGLGVERLGERSVTYRLAVFREEADEPSAVGRFVHVYVDPATRRPTPIPEEIGRALDVLASRPGDR